MGSWLLGSVCWREVGFKFQGLAVAVGIRANLWMGDLGDLLDSTVNFVVRVGNVGQDLLRCCACGPETVQS